MRSPMIAGIVVFASVLVAQDPSPSPAFAPPVRLKAGDKFLGHERLFPSPVFHDVNGDGLADIVVGDLAGRLTVARRLPGPGPARYGPETRIMAANGEELDFSNW